MKLYRSWNNYTIFASDLSGKLPEGLKTVTLLNIKFYNESGVVFSDICTAIFKRSVYENTSNCFAELRDSASKEYASNDLCTLSEFYGMQNATIRRAVNFSRKENFLTLKPLGKKYYFVSDKSRHAYRDGDLYIYVTPDTFYEDKPRKFSWLSADGHEQYNEITRFYCFKPEGAESEHELLIGVNQRDTVKTPAGQYVENIRNFLAHYLEDYCLSESRVLEVIRHKDELINLLQGKGRQ